MPKTSVKRILATSILPLINGVARHVSLKLVPASTPTRSFREFFTHLDKLDVRFQTVIDVGVAHGSPEIYESLPHAKYFLVEPVPGCKPLLDRLAARLDAQTFNVAAGAEDGALEFFVHQDVSGSSAYRQWEGEFLDGEAVTVPVRRLDRMIPSAIARPSLLKIDTQGAELEVLAGATGILPFLDMVIIESSFHQFRKGAPEFHEVVARMVELGFVCYEVLEGHYRLVDHALAQVDLAFVRPDSPLRAEKGFFSRQQAERYVQG